MVLQLNYPLTEVKLLKEKEEKIGILSRKLMGAL